MEEIWKPIKGFEHLYQVSNMGRIKSLDRYVKNGNGRRIVRGKILSLRHNSTGYLFVTLYDSENSKQRDIYVHKAVADAFLDNGQTPGLTVDHRDNDTFNNCAANLRMLSQSENSARWRREIKGWDTTKLKPSQVRWIRYRYSLGGVSYKVLAECFQVSWRTIQKVVKRDTWKNII